MSIYKIDGTEFTAPGAVDGTSLETAYDIKGNVVFAKTPPGSTTITVMTYNVQYFTGINSQTAMQTAIVGLYEPDIIGMQELRTYTASSLPAAGQSMLANYPVKQFSDHTNKVLMATKSIELGNIVIADYVHQDPEDASRWSETRAYLKAEMIVGGRTITWFNTHLCFLTESIKWQQMMELFALAEQCEYCIITGDFNSMVMSEQADDYINMYKPFVDAGYHLANNSPTAGFHNTYTNQSAATSLADLQTAPDTIITSGNIDIDSIVFDTTKFNYLNGSVIDHIPVVARLTIY